METTSNSDIFDVNVTKTKDGRTRRQREDSGNLADISDISPGKALMKNEPGTELKT
jgi:hypothetical protein